MYTSLFSPVHTPAPQLHQTKSFAATCKMHSRGAEFWWSSQGGSASWCGSWGASAPGTPHPSHRLPPPPERRPAPNNFSVPSSQRELQQSVAWTIALSFLFPKRDQLWRPFERAVITSSFVGNGISMAHGRALDSSAGLAGTAHDGDSGKNGSRLPSPSMLPSSTHQGKKGGWMQRPENGINPNPMRRGLAASPSPDSSTNQGSLNPETQETAL